MELEKITLNEVSQTQKDEYVYSTWLTEDIQDSQGKENRINSDRCITRCL